MKKIVRLTESDLIRLVKRVINEQTTPSTGIGKSAAIDFIAALSKPIDDEQAAVNAVNKLINKNDLTEFKNVIKIKTNMDVCDYFNHEMSTLTRREFNQIQYKLKELGLYCKATSVTSTILNKLRDPEQNSY